MVMAVEQTINSDPHAVGFNNSINNRIIKFTQDKTFLITGCQGTRVSITKGIFGKQEIVARAIREHLIKKVDLHAYLGMLLGDHFYPSGTDNEKHDYFKAGFEDVYNFSIPFFNILGNHDWNFHGSSFKQSDNDADHNKRAASQVLRTFYRKNKPIDYLQAEVENGYLLKHWNMPGRYYCLEFPSSVLFMIDSNTYAFDQNQQAWLKKVYALYPTKKKVLVSHHPFFSYGKRSTPNGKRGDVEKYYLNEYQGIVMDHNKSMNDLLREKIIGEQRLKFDVLLSAHDHMLAVSEHDGMTQIIVGGGGSLLEKIKGDVSQARAKSAYGFMEFHTEDLAYQITEVVPKIMPGCFRTQIFEDSRLPRFGTHVFPVGSRRPPQPLITMTDNPTYESAGTQANYDHLNRNIFDEPAYESISGRSVSEIYEKAPEKPGDAPISVYEDVDAADIIATAVDSFEQPYDQPKVGMPPYSQVIPRGQRVPK